MAVSRLQTNPRQATQSNGIVGRHRTPLDEHTRIEGRRTWFETLVEIQAVSTANSSSKKPGGHTREAA